MSYPRHFWGPRKFLVKKIGPLAEFKAHVDYSSQTEGRIRYFAQYSKTRNDRQNK